MGDVGFGNPRAGGGGRFGNGYWTHGRFMVETNDAYVAANISVISSRIQGYAAEVPATENAYVSAGNILVRLDDGDCRVALQVAQSRVVSAGETLSWIDAQGVTAGASVAQAVTQRDVPRARFRSANHRGRPGAPPLKLISSTLRMVTVS
jgi:membrane fusion protein (multidrug efflux system)